MDVEGADCDNNVVVMVQHGAGGTKQDTAAAVALSAAAAARAAGAEVATEGTDASSFASAAATSESAAPLPDAVKEVLKVSFPRCSVCKTDWYDATIQDEGNNDATTDDLDRKPAAADKSNNDRKRKQHRHRPSHYNLLPMPECGCTTRLALPHGMSSAIFADDNDNDCCKEGGKDDPVKILSQISTHSFPNLAICKVCLQKRIDASNEITVHDYRQEHIVNGQRNVRFTVEPSEFR